MNCLFNFGLIGATMSGLLISSGLTQAQTVTSRVSQSSIEGVYICSESIEYEGFWVQVVVNSEWPDKLTTVIDIERDVVERNQGTMHRAFDMILDMLEEDARLACNSL